MQNKSGLLALIEYIIESVPLQSWYAGSAPSDKKYSTSSTFPFYTAFRSYVLPFLSIILNISSGYAFGSICCD